MTFRLPLSIVSPLGARGRLSILIFHRVLAEPDELFPETPVATEFERSMRWVKEWFNVLPLGEAVDMLFAGRIPSRALSITFDDGYADNEELAAVILRRLGMPATVFVATGFLDGGCMWNDRIIEAIRGCEATRLDLQPLGLTSHELDSTAARRSAIDTVLHGIKHLDPQRRLQVTDAIVQAAGGKPSPQLMMRTEQVRNLRSLGMEVGAHTVTHPILTRLDPAAAHDEISRGKRELEAIVGEPVRLFAYPNGTPDRDYGPEHAAQVRECGFSAAVSTSWGAASVHSDRFQLPRFTPWDRTRLRFGARMLANFARTEQLAA
ncbi:MAG: polysaccharide deacetylase family protein [Caldimonas sp.]